jgi:hypothetical protein
MNFIFTKKKNVTIFSTQNVPFNAWYMVQLNDKDCKQSVTCNSHPSNYWPRSLQLNLHDQERHSTASPEKLAPLRGSISSLYTVHYTSPFFREASSRSLTRILSGCLAMQWFPSYTTIHLLLLDNTRPNTCLSSFLTTSIVVSGLYHVQLTPKKDSYQTPESQCCHHL